MTRALSALALVALLAGCGSNGDEPSAGDGSPVEKCVERLAARLQDTKVADPKGFARRSYCEPLDKQGLVHEDGTLKIPVVQSGASLCAAPQPGEPVQTIPCNDIPGPLLDCGLLDLVRRAEAQAYIKKREEEGDVRCDDGTPLDELGS